MSKAGAPLKDIPDFSIYLQNNGTDKESGDVVLSTGIVSHRKNVFARSRFTKCATTIEPFTAENLRKTVEIACEEEAKLLGIECISFEEQRVKNEKQLEESKPNREEIIADIKTYGKILKDFADEKIKLAY